MADSNIEYYDFLRNPQKYMTPEQLKDWRNYNSEFEKQNKKFFPNPAYLPLEDDKLWDDWEKTIQELQKKYNIKPADYYIKQRQDEQKKEDKDSEPVPPGTLLVKKNRDLEMKLLGYA